MEKFENRDVRMTLPTMWIRKHMLGSTSSSNIFNERTLTEAEMKVQRSIQKLSIPEWYLNKSSRPPKILTNDTPIESRPAPWKQQRGDKKNNRGATQMPTKNTTVNRNGLLETDFGCSISSKKFVTPTTNHKTQKTGTSSSSKNRPESTSKTDAPERKKSPRPRSMNISRTFPRVSPSRKIQNINIVFPVLPNNAVSQTITTNDDEDNSMNMTKDSLEATITSTIYEDDVDDSTIVGNATPTSENLRSKISRMPDQRLIYIKPWKSPATHRITKIGTDFNNKIGNDHSEKSSREINNKIGNDFSKKIGYEIDYKIGNDNDEKIGNGLNCKIVDDYDEKIDNDIHDDTGNVLEREIGNDFDKTTGKNFDRQIGVTSTPRNTSSSFVSKARPIYDESIDSNRSKNRQTEISSFATSNVSNSKTQPPKVAPRTSIPIIPYHDDDDDDDYVLCEACKADPNRRNPKASNYRISGILRPTNLYPIDEKSVVTPKSRPSSSSNKISPTVIFFTSTKKSSELRNIIKTKESQRNGKSLVQEIIEEFNVKCKNSVQPSFVTRGSKRFVRKLVRALEKTNESSIEETDEKIVCERLPIELKKIAKNEKADEKIVCERLPIESEKISKNEETEISEIGSEEDVKSASVSTTISFKDTDSFNISDTEQRSAYSQKPFVYDWNMNVPKCLNETMTITDSKNESMTLNEENYDDSNYDDDDDSVYWIPVTKTKLPRTSSLLSMVSRLSTNGQRQILSPCVSPIRQTNENTKKNQNSNSAWGMTYKTSDYVRTLRRIEETTILDSGYSDKSRGHCSLSFDSTWYDDVETTQTASENGSFSSFSHGSCDRRSSGRFIARPFVI